MFLPSEMLDVLPLSSGSAGVAGAASCGEGCMSVVPGWEKGGINVGGIKVSGSSPQLLLEGISWLGEGGVTKPWQWEELRYPVGRGPPSSTCKESETEP